MFPTTDKLIYHPWVVKHMANRSPNAGETFVLYSEEKELRSTGKFGKLIDLGKKDLRYDDEVYLFVNYGGERVRVGDSPYRVASLLKNDINRAMSSLNLSRGSYNASQYAENLKNMIEPLIKEVP